MIFDWVLLLLPLDCRCWRRRRRSEESSPSMVSPNFSFDDGATLDSELVSQSELLLADLLAAALLLS